MELAESASADRAHRANTSEASSGLRGAMTSELACKYAGGGEQPEFCARVTVAIVYLSLDEAARAERVREHALLLLGLLGLGRELAGQPVKAVADAVAALRAACLGAEKGLGHG